MSYSAYNEAALQQDYVKTIFATLRRRWFSIFCWTMFWFGVLAVAVQFLPKTYHGVASVEVLAKTPTVANPDIVTGDQVFTDETAGTELGILQSQELRTAVIMRLGLLSDPEFNPTLHESRLARLISYIRQSPIAQYIPPTWLPSVEPASSEQALYDTVQTFARKVVIEPVSHSKIISITAASANPVTAAKVANATVTEYIAAHTAQKEDAYRQAYDFTNLRLPKLRADMIAKSAEVTRFREQHGLVSGQYAAHSRENLSEAAKLLVNEQNQLAVMRAQLAQARTSSVMSNPAVMASQTIQRLREQQAQIAAEGATRPWLAGQYALRTQAIEADIRAEASRIVQTLPNQVAAMDASVRAQKLQVQFLQEEVSRMDALQSELDPLENDANVARKMYNDFLSSDSVSRPDVAFTAVNVRAMSAAATPFRPYFPNNMLMLPASLVVSFIGVVGWTLLRSRRVGFLTTAQIQNVFRIEPIGRIPFRTHRMEAVYEEAVFYLSMRLCSPYNIQRQTILITSTMPNEGKTTIARDLANAFAKRNISVALVDADMRIANKPGEVVGLRNVLTGDARLEEVAIANNGVTMIQAGARRANRGYHSSSLIASDQMPVLLQQLHDSHDIVIVDGPPALVGGDSWALAKLVDMVLFIVQQAGPSEADVETAFRSLDKPIDQIGVALNMIRTGNVADSDPAFSRQMLAYYSHK